MSAYPEWKTTENKVLKEGYADGLSSRVIGELLGRSSKGVQAQAGKLGIKHKHGRAAEAVRLFEESMGMSLNEAVEQYKANRLSRADLAADIGIHLGTLKRMVPPDLWEPWPHNTVGRQLLYEQRRN